MAVPPRRTALQTFQDRELMPTHLNSEEISTSITREAKERAFIMSKVRDIEILQKFKDETEAVIRGDYDESRAMKEIMVWLKQKGYTPADGKRGTLEDLSSIARIGVVLETNVAIARGYSDFLHRLQTQKTYPAQRLVRKAQKKVPRPWREERWPAAYAATDEDPGAHPTEMAALLLHGVWIQLSRFSNPYPPFDFGSGMGVEPVSREEAKDLGLLPVKPPGAPPIETLPSPQQAQEPQIVAPSMNESLEVKPDIVDPEMKGMLSTQLGNLSEWKGAELIATDPNGTRRATANALKRVWDGPAPVGFESLPQRDAIEQWKGGYASVSDSAAFHLGRLFSRIETLIPPPRVWRSASVTATEARSLIASLAAESILAIPANVVGWEFADEPLAAAEAMPNPGNSWTFLIQVQPSGRVIDVRDLRPGKPGFVYAANQLFEVTEYRVDEGLKHITIIAKEA